jgi:hypothetical protein
MILPSAQLLSKREIAMFGLTSLGLLHTAIALIAIAAGILCFVRSGGISLRSTAGKVYIIMTVLTFTRIPAGAPVFEGPEAPGLQTVIGVFFILYLVGAGYQVWRLHAGQRSIAVAS